MHIRTEMIVHNSKVINRGLGLLTHLTSLFDAIVPIVLEHFQSGTVRCVCVCTLHDHVNGTKAIIIEIRNGDDIRVYTYIVRIDDDDDDHNNNDDDTGIFQANKSNNVYNWFLY